MLAGIIPFFQNLIDQGADHLPITDERMTRFWITLQQGVDFVIDSLHHMHGGEIFVPRIPSMRITDLARAMAPNLPHKIVGIRPGEKLHETMITADDALNTAKIENGFVIKPQMTFWARSEKTLNLGTPVPEDFVYSSDTNTEWVSTEQLLNMINC